MEKTMGAKPQQTQPPVFRQLLGRTDFRLLWLSQATGRLGDQIYLVALPWLVLQLTGDVLTMSVVLATASLPRALFMLVGGALADRLSSHTVMRGSYVLRRALVGLLAGLVLTGWIQLWMLYVIAFAFGLVDAFFYPALNSIVPHLVEPAQLKVGNAFIQGTGQLSLFAGPVIAGTAIALLTNGSVHSLFGIGWVFGLDALAFLVSGWMLWRMSNPASKTTSQTGEGAVGVWSSIRQGLVYVCNDATVRTFFFITAAVTMLINGPFSVGVPVLADTRLPEGAAAFGIIVSAFGGGSLIGTALSAILPKAPPQWFGVVLLGVSSVLGIGLTLLGLAVSTPVAAVIAFVMGIANGYVVIEFITWLQTRTPPALLGRMMSLLMFAMVGLNPISAALAGLVIQQGTTLLFVTAGVALCAIILVSLFSPAVRPTTSDGTVRVAPKCV